MRRTIATLALAAAAVLAGSGSALAHGGPEHHSDNDVHVVEHGDVDVTIIVCGDFSECEGDED
jgi:hypothetical protein